MAALSLYTARRCIDNQHFHFCYFKKLALLAPGSGRCSPSQGLVSFSSFYRLEDLRSTLGNSDGRSDHLGLVPFTLGVQELSSVTRDVRAFLHQPRERLLIGLEKRKYWIVNCRNMENKPNFQNWNNWFSRWNICTKSRNKSVHLKLIGKLFLNFRFLD